MEDNNYDDDTIIDGSAEYSPKSEFSKPKIVFDASERCMVLRAKEMKKGYFNTTVSKDGLPIRTWIEDSRKAYCSAVSALCSILIPEILDDEDYQDKKKKDEEWKNPIEKIKIDMTKCLKKYSYYVLEPQRTKDNKLIYVAKDNYFLPEVDAVVPIRKVFPDGNEELIESFGCWNKYIDAYWNKMVHLSDNLFEELIRIIHRKNYFKQSIRYG